MSSPNEAPKKRIILPEARTLGTQHQISKVSDTAAMLERALRTLSEQLDKLALKSRAAVFDEREARVLQGYIKSLVELSKEERERDKDDKTSDLSKLTDSELLELAKSKLIQAKND